MKKVGLALWWWASKWFSHIGVIKYLEEHNIEIEEISGTSIGAIVWAMYAAWFDSRQLIEAANDLTYSELIDIDFGQWIIKGEKMVQKLKHYIWDISFEELKIPLKVIATNIDTGREEVFLTWSVLEAVSYSISIPGLISVKQSSKDENYYVDGWVVNNLPVSHISSETVVASSCKGVSTFQAKTTKEVFWKTFDISVFTLPKRVMLRAFTIMMRRLEDFELARHPDVILVRPNLEKIGLLDLDIVDEATKLWYQEAQRVFSWKE